MSRRKPKSYENKAVSILFNFKTDFKKKGKKRKSDNNNCVYCCVISVGLGSSSDGNLIGTNVKQEPVSDDEVHSEEGFPYDGENDDEENFVHSKFIVPFSFEVESKQFFAFVFVYINM